MNVPDSPRNDRILRAAAWLYVVPRAAKGTLILALLGLAAFMMIAALALNLLHHLGA